MDVVGGELGKSRFRGKSWIHPPRVLLENRQYNKCHQRAANFGYTSASREGADPIRPHPCDNDRRLAVQ